MKEENPVGRCWGVFCATVVSTIYFLWISGLSSRGRMDKNVAFYIGGCAIYFVSYFIADKIFSNWIKVNVKSIPWICMIAVGATPFWIVYSYMRDPQLYPVSALTTHDFPIVLHFILLIGMVIIYAMAGCDSKSRNKKIRWVMAVMAVTIQVALLYAPNVFSDPWPGRLYHIHAYVNSIINTLSSQPFDETNSSIYGHYALFYAIPVKILHTVLGISNLTSIVLTICMVGIITFIVSYYLLNRLIRSNKVYCVSIVAFTVISTFCYGVGQYYQVLPHRILFQALVLYGAWYSIYVKRKKVLLWIICTCSIIWNIEIGLICCAASYVLNIWFDIEKDRKYSKAVLYVIKNLVLMISELVSAYIAVNIYNVCNGGGWNSIKTFIFPLMCPEYMFERLPTALPDIFAGYFLEIMLFMGVLCYCLTKLFQSRDADCENNNKYVFLIFNSLMGLGCLTYYMNRAARTNLYISHVELIVLLAVCADIKTVQGTFKFHSFSVDDIRRVVKYFAALFLVSLVLDSVGNVDGSVQSRIQTTWDTNSLENICKEVQETVPEGTIGFGMGVPELYSALNRETGLYIWDWADYTFFDTSPINDVMLTSERIFANKESFRINRNHVDFVCSQSYEINDLAFGLFEKNQMQPEDGIYDIIPKLDSAFNITTDGQSVFLGNELSLLLLTDHILTFADNMALEVPNDFSDGMGRIQLQKQNDIDNQRWCMEEKNGYYMICWHDYALTYDLNDSSIRLMPITGGDNQLWRMDLSG